MKYKVTFKKHICLIVVLILCMSSVSFADSNADTIDEVIKYQRVNYSIPSMAVTIVKDGEVIYEKVEGSAESESSILLTDDTTMIQTGSLSKLITTLALLKLMDEQGITSDTLISDYLIDDYVPSETLTFGDLLQHTTGIPALKFDVALKASPLSENQSFSQYADAFMKGYKHKEIMPSGQYTIYSNVGVVMAGLLVEALSNEPYESYVADSVLAPMGMAHSAEALKGTLDTGSVDLATGYNVFGGAQTAQEHFQTKLIASEDFVTTVSDMTALMQSLTALSSTDELYQQLFTRQVSVYRNILGRSMGLTIKREHGNDIYLQDGAIPGETTRLFFVPSQGLGVFIWYNSNATALRDVLTESILNTYTDTSNAAIPQPVEVTDNTNAHAFIGAYSPVNISQETIEGVTKIIHQIRVADEGDTLTIDQSSYTLIGEDLYYSASEDQYARFIVDESVKKTYLVINNTFYEKVGLFRSLYFQAPILFLAALFNFIALVYILIRWQAMLVNRIHSTPRVVLLSETLTGFASIILIMITALKYNAWVVAYNTSVTGLWLKVMGILTGVLLIPAFIMLGRATQDFRWRGSTLFLFRMLIILNGLMVVWLWYYNFI